VLACIGEQFEEGDEVCGVTVNIRQGKNRIEMWTKTAANEALQISVGKQLKQLLDVSDNTKIGFSVFVSGFQGWEGRRCAGEGRRGAKLCVRVGRAAIISLCRPFLHRSLTTHRTKHHRPTSCSRARPGIGTLFEVGSSGSDGWIQRLVWCGGGGRGAWMGGRWC